MFFVELIVSQKNLSKDTSQKYFFPLLEIFMFVFIVFLRNMGFLWGRRLDLDLFSDEDLITLHEYLLSAYILQSIFSPVAPNVANE